MSWKDMWPENPSDNFDDEFLDNLYRDTDNNFNSGEFRLFGNRPLIGTDWDEELKRLKEEEK